MKFRGQKDKKFIKHRLLNFEENDFLNAVKWVEEDTWDVYHFSDYIPDVQEHPYIEKIVQKNLKEKIQDRSKNLMLMVHNGAGYHYEKTLKFIAEISEDE